MNEITNQWEGDHRGNANTAIAVWTGDNLFEDVDCIDESELPGWLGELIQEYADTRKESANAKDQHSLEVTQSLYWIRNEVADNEERCLPLADYFEVITDEIQHHEVPETIPHWESVLRWAGFTGLSDLRDLNLTQLAPTYNEALCRLTHAVGLPVKDAVLMTAMSFAVVCVPEIMERSDHFEFGSYEQRTEMKKQGIYSSLAPDDAAKLRNIELCMRNYYQQNGESDL